MVKNLIHITIIIKEDKSRMSLGGCEITNLIGFDLLKGKLKAFGLGTDLERGQKKKGLSLLMKAIAKPNVLDNRIYTLDTQNTKHLRHNYTFTLFTL